MPLPSTWFSFCGREIARYGKDGVVLIDVGTPAVSRQSTTRQYCEAEHIDVEDLGNQSVQLEITVHREFKSYAEKRRWLLPHLANVCKGAGEMKIIEDGEVFVMPKAVMSLETAEDDGVAVALVYTFLGGEFKQILAKTK